MPKPPILVAAFLALALAGYTRAEQPATQDGAAPPIQWVGFEAGLATARSTGKHVMIDVYTDWCHYCKKLDSETYSQEQVRRILADSYVSVKLKGDSGRKLKVVGQPLETNGKTLLQFVTTDSAATSEQALSRQTLRVRGFPTIAFLAADGRLITKYDGYLNPEQFTHIINFIKDDLYEVMTFGDYLESLEKAKGKS
jgi:thioredoxin-related protein